MLREEERIRDINASEFERVFTPDIRKVVKTIREYGFDLRVVGGAVRDFLRDTPPRDIDFATDADPSELIYILQLEGIDFDAKGIGHGTIKARFGDDKIDITSMTYKLGLDDHKVRITRRSTWEQDALSRDLTINSLIMDLNGRIYDYVGGLDDLANGMVRFNPGTAEHLGEDPHLIMRWFKALGYFDHPTWPKRDWDAIREHLPLLAKIRDDEKTAKEITSIMRGMNASKVRGMMCRSGAAEYLDLTCD